MDILMVAARCHPFMGGIETHIGEVGPRLAARGHRVDVLTTDPTRRLPAEEHIRGVRIRRVPAWPRERDFYLAPGIRDEILRGDWDIVHFQGYNTFVPPVGMAAALWRGFPFVLTFHSGGHSSRLRNAVRGVQRALLRPLLARADRLIGVSRFEAEFFAARLGLAPDRFAVVPNGAAMPAPGPEVEVDPTLVVSAGRLERYKGHHRLVEAMPHLIRRVPTARLRIVGHGPYEPELRRLVARLGLSSRVSIEAIPGGERRRMADLLAGAGLFVLFSEYEAHPVAVMEALALRRPVLVADTSGLSEIADAGLCRALPPAVAADDLAAAMADELAAQRAPPGLKLPDWDDCAGRLLDIYRDVLCRRTTAGIPAQFAPWSPTEGAGEG